MSGIFFGKSKYSKLEVNLEKIKIKSKEEEEKAEKEKEEEKAQETGGLEVEKVVTDDRVPWLEVDHKGFYENSSVEVDIPNKDAISSTNVPSDGTSVGVPEEKVNKSETKRTLPNIVRPLTITKSVLDLQTTITAATLQQSFVKDADDKLVRDIVIRSFDKIREPKSGSESTPEPHLEPMIKPAVEPEISPFENLDVPDRKADSDIGAKSSDIKSADMEEPKTPDSKGTGDIDGTGRIDLSMLDDNLFIRGYLEQYRDELYSMNVSNEVHQSIMSEMENSFRTYYTENGTVGIEEYLQQTFEKLKQEFITHEPEETTESEELITNPNIYVNPNVGHGSEVSSDIVPRNIDDIPAPNSATQFGITDDVALPEDEGVQTGEGEVNNDYEPQIVGLFVSDKNSIPQELQQYLKPVIDANNKIIGYQFYLTTSEYRSIKSNPKISSIVDKYFRYETVEDNKGGTYDVYVVNNPESFFKDYVIQSYFDNNIRTNWCLSSGYCSEYSPQGKFVNAATLYAHTFALQNLFNYEANAGNFEEYGLIELAEGKDNAYMCLLDSEFRERLVGMINDIINANYPDLPDINVDKILDSMLINMNYGNESTPEEILRTISKELQKQIAITFKEDFDATAKNYAVNVLPVYAYNDNGETKLRLDRKVNNIDLVLEKILNDLPKEQADMLLEYGEDAVKMILQKFMSYDETITISLNSLIYCINNFVTEYCDELESIEFDVLGCDENSDNVAYSSDYYTRMFRTDSAENLKNNITPNDVNMIRASVAKNLLDVGLDEQTVKDLVDSVNFDRYIKRVLAVTNDKELSLYSIASQITTLIFKDNAELSKLYKDNLPSDYSDYQLDFLKDYGINSEEQSMQILNNIGKAGFKSIQEFQECLAIFELIFNAISNELGSDVLFNLINNSLNTVSNTHVSDDAKKSTFMYVLLNNLTEILNNHPEIISSYNSGLTTRGINNIFKTDENGSLIFTDNEGNKRSFSIQNNSEGGGIYFGCSIVNSNGRTIMSYEYDSNEGPIYAYYGSQYTTYHSIDRYGNHVYSYAEHVYDDLGNESIIITEIKFDSDNNRMISESQYSSNDSTYTEYVYDKNNRVISEIEREVNDIEHIISRKKYEYDENGKLLSIREIDAQFNEYVQTYIYDENGDLSQIVETDEDGDERVIYDFEKWKDTIKNAEGQWYNQSPTKDIGEGADSVIQEVIEESKGSNTNNDSSNTSYYGSGGSYSIYNENPWNTAPTSGRGSQFISDMADFYGGREYGIPIIISGAIRDRLNGYLESFRRALNKTTMSASEKSAYMNSVRNAQQPTLQSLNQTVRFERFQIVMALQGLTSDELDNDDIVWDTLANLKQSFDIKLPPKETGVVFVQDENNVWQEQGTSGARENVTISFNALGNVYLDGRDISLSGFSGF